MRLLLRALSLAVLSIALLISPSPVEAGPIGAVVGEIVNANFVLGVAGDPERLNTETFNYFVSANREGFRIAKNLYVLGIGLDVSSEFGLDIQGASATLPIVTYRPGGGQFVLQGGYARGVTGSVRGDNRVYLGFGFTRK